MFFNENEVYQMMKLRQEETERNALNAWKNEVVEKESILEKVVRKWNNRNKSFSIPQQNCCACHC
ncbi:hypothetical protein [Bacillus sp. USDA818B3_A]|uniref:hypothetical protein n=1 Tax=Bacillus sp. USDA818B3_A TaxID=2698834 RepID=UPI00137118E6|nr:hypothetical protein [Bacillus sp. USDA818B3_A]